MILYIYIIVVISVAGSRYVKNDALGLTIKNATLSDNGEYTCRAVVEADGRMEEKKIQVEVHSQYNKSG